MQIIKGIRKQA